jgi:multidrug efflux system membrane fusion protein
VRAAVAARKDVPILIRAIGSVEPFTNVEIRAQVGGALRAVHFREGRDVQRGDRLFSLDARPYEAALDKARARLARDQVQLETARQDAERYRDLVAKDFVTREEFDRIRTTAAALEATVRADEAAMRNTEVELEHCTIRSPIDGRTGTLMVHAGNLVKANSDNPLVVINQISPINVSFSVPEEHLAAIKARMARDPLEVRAARSDAARVPGPAAGPATGTLSFVDNAVDRATGTVLLKAIFPNRDRALWPGQFVDTTLRLGTRSGAVVVPTQAIQTGQQGLFVFVVGADLTVASRPIVGGPAADGETVVEQGIEAGEQVVTDGQLRIVPGARVEIKTGEGA